MECKVDVCNIKPRKSLLEFPLPMSEDAFDATRNSGPTRVSIVLDDCCCSFYKSHSTHTQTNNTLAKVPLLFLHLLILLSVVPLGG